jgi:hypothetical protein
LRRNPLQDYLATVVTTDEFDRALRTARPIRSPKVPDWLYDYEDSEMATARAISDSQARHDLVNIRDFFPELNLTGAYCDRLPGEPVWLLLPFFDQVIVWLEPVRSADAFLRLYGVSPDTFVDLCGERPGAGKIIPFASLRTTRRGSVRDLAISCYCQVCAFGGEDLARAAVAGSRSSDAMVDKLFYYAVALYDSFVSPLGGTYPCNRAQLRTLAGAVDPHMHPTAELFPIEIGRSIIESLPLPLPVALCNRQWWITDGRDLWMPAREALTSLDAALANTAQGLSERTDRLREVWNQTGKELRRSRALKKRLTWVTSTIAVAGTMAGVGAPGTPGLIASLLGTAATLSIFDIEGVYRHLFRPRHLVALVDLRDHLDARPLTGCP